MSAWVGQTVWHVIVTVLTDVYWRDEIVDAGRVPDLLGQLGSGPIIGIREWDSSCEVDVRLLRPFYYIARGGEGLFTDRTLDGLSTPLTSRRCPSVVCSLVQPWI
jgi:hypothetical protein